MNYETYLKDSLNLDLSDPERTMITRFVMEIGTMNLSDTYATQIGQHTLTGMIDIADALGYQVQYHKKGHLIYELTITKPFEDDLLIIITF